MERVRFSHVWLSHALSPAHSVLWEWMACPNRLRLSAKAISKSKWLGLPDGSVPSVIGRLYRANGSDGSLECAKVGYFGRKCYVSYLPRGGDQEIEFFENPLRPLKIEANSSLELVCAEFFKAE